MHYMRKGPSSKRRGYFFFWVLGGCIVSCYFESLCIQPCLIAIKVIPSISYDEGLLPSILVEFFLENHLLQTFWKSDCILHCMWKIGNLGDHVVMFLLMKWKWSCWAYSALQLVCPFCFSNSSLFVEQGLWLRLLKLGATDDPLSSFEYGTILGMLQINNVRELSLSSSLVTWFEYFCYVLISIHVTALIESDAEGIGGSGFVECIREHINSVCLAIMDKLWIYDWCLQHHANIWSYFLFQGWHCQLTDEQFIAVKELVCRF